MKMEFKKVKLQPSTLAIYGLVLAAALLMKYHYSVAEVGQLSWILKPTAVTVQWLTGISFDFEALSGYVNWQHGMVIAKPCAGINFFIISFCMVALSQVRRIKTWQHRIYFLFGCSLGIFIYTVLVNAIRIVVALQLHHMNLSFGWLNPSRIHRLAGILIYFISLCLLHFALLRLSKRKVYGWHMYLPLVCYLAIAVIIPLGLMIISGIRSGFFEHILTTLLVSTTIFWGYLTISRNKI
jgi:exosortase K